MFDQEKYSVADIFVGMALSKPTSGCRGSRQDIDSLGAPCHDREEVISSAITHDSCTVTIPNGDWTVKTCQNNVMFTICNS